MNITRGFVDTLSARTRGRMRLLWPVMFRWLRQRLINDLFDNVERELTRSSDDAAARDRHG